MSCPPQIGSLDVECLRLNAWEPVKEQTEDHPSAYREQGRHDQCTEVGELHGPDLLYNEGVVFLIQIFKLEPWTAVNTHIFLI